MVSYWDQGKRNEIEQPEGESIGAGILVEEHPSLAISLSALTNDAIVGNRIIPFFIFNTAMGTA